MSLQECIAAAQAEMKGRIEEECRKQMNALLEDTFAKKWEEYTSKAVATVNVSSLYTEGYGRLDVNSFANNQYTSSMQPNAKTLFSKLPSFYEFSTKNLYFVHCITNYEYTYPNWKLTSYLIDNYGFNYQVHSEGTYMKPDKPVMVDVSKGFKYQWQTGHIVSQTEQYLYPLPDVLIDIIKTLPEIITPTPSYGYGHVIQEPIIKILPSIRKAAALFHEHTIAFDTLKRENTILHTSVQKQNATFDNIINENDMLKEHISDLTARHEEQTSAFNTLKEENETLKACISSLEDSSSTLTARYEEQTAAFHALKEEHEALKARLSAIDNSPLQYNVEVATSAEDASLYNGLFSINFSNFMIQPHPQE